MLGQVYSLDIQTLDIFNIGIISFGINNVNPIYHKIFWAVHPEMFSFHIVFIPLINGMCKHS